MHLVLGRLAATKLKSFNFLVEWVSEVTFGLCCYVLSTKLGAVLLLRIRHKACAWQARWRQN